MFLSRRNFCFCLTSILLASRCLGFYNIGKFWEPLIEKYLLTDEHDIVDDKGKLDETNLIYAVVSKSSNFEKLVASEIIDTMDINLDDVNCVDALSQNTQDVLNGLNGEQRKLLVIYNLEYAVEKDVKALDFAFGITEVAAPYSNLIVLMVFNRPKWIDKIAKYTGRNAWKDTIGHELDDPKKHFNGAAFAGRISRIAVEKTQDDLNLDSTHTHLREFCLTLESKKRTKNLITRVSIGGAALLVVAVPVLGYLFQKSAVKEKNDDGGSYGGAGGGYGKGSIPAVPVGSAGHMLPHEHGYDLFPSRSMETRSMTKAYEELEHNEHEAFEGGAVADEGQYRSPEHTHYQQEVDAGGEHAILMETPQKEEKGHRKTAKKNTPQSEPKAGSHRKVSKY